MRKLSALLGLLLGAAAASPAEADYPFTFDEGRRCRPVVAQFLQEKGIPPESIDKIYFEERTSPSLSNPRLIGFDAWVRPKGVKGYLVINMGLGCGIQRVYTTGDYKVDGIR